MTTAKGLRHKVSFLAALCCLASLHAQSRIDPGRYLGHIKFLASDELQGRGNGQPGLEKAADYIGAALRAAGLTGGGPASSFFQAFDIVEDQRNGGQPAATSVVAARARVRNVIGVLRGRDARLAEEVIVVGAHYDHVGLGDRHATGAPGQVHNGADDNASGIAALLEMASIAARTGGFPRTVVFVAFAGEEIGLLGSAHYVAHPTLPLERTVAMINLDMVGRPRGRILVTGLEPPLVHADEVKALRAMTTIELRPTAELYGAGSSDDSSFAARRIPTIVFFSGFHEDYHRPSDDWQRIEPEGGVEVAKIALALVRRLAER